jgi:hypothetical protein
MPHHVGLRITVQQEERRPTPSDADVNALDRRVVEALEHDADPTRVDGSGAKSAALSSAPPPE